MRAHWRERYQIHLVVPKPWRPPASRQVMLCSSSHYRGIATSRTEVVLGGRCSQIQCASELELREVCQCLQEHSESSCSGLGHAQIVGVWPKMRVQEARGDRSVG